MKKISLLFMFVLLAGCTSGDIPNPDKLIEDIRKCQSIGSKTIRYFQPDNGQPIQITCSGLSGNDQ